MGKKSKRAKSRKKAVKAKRKPVMGQARRIAGKTVKRQARKFAAKRMKKPAKKTARKVAGKPAGKAAKKAAGQRRVVKMAAKKKADAGKTAAEAVRAAETAARKMPKQPSAHLAEKRRPRCLVLAGFGLNAEAELAHAFLLAGADAQIVHFSDISSGRKRLSDYEIFAIPGGWSYGDDISGGRVLANKLKHSFKSQFDEFVSSGKPILGVCNGFQVLVKLGALPNMSGEGRQESTLTFNKSGRFEDRWVCLKPQKSACRYFEGIPLIRCPVRHGEGQFVPRDAALLSQLQRQGMVALRYAGEAGQESPGYPANPNGSPHDIAGICDKSGRILGLMPHIECAVMRCQFPRFTAGISSEKDSLRFFANIVKAAEEYI